MNGVAWIPHSEERALGSTLREAFGLAGSGKILLGFRRLIGGLEEAEDALDRNVEWAPRLVSWYHAALKEYASRYGLPLR